jgi:glycosyltransferase involved in cell wall biosynthesis
MKPLPKISVVIPCFNHGEFLPEAVRSVTDTGRDDIELVVVDDGSTDERTRKEMDALCAQGVKVIRQKNRGLGAARNAGAAASLGQYLFPLDADDRMRSVWIDRAIGVLESDPRVGIVYGDAQCFGTRTEQWKTGPFEPNRLLYTNFIHASALYRRSVWEQNGGYDETMPVQGMEDWDFWVGAFERGWRFHYLAEIFFDYRRAERSMLTRAAEAHDQLQEFVARKHSSLYRQAWLSVLNECESILNERESIKWNLRNLRKLLLRRLKARFNKDGVLSRDLSAKHACR